MAFLLLYFLGALHWFLKGSENMRVRSQHILRLAGSLKSLGRFSAMNFAERIIE